MGILNTFVIANIQNTIPEEFQDNDSSESHYIIQNFLARTKAFLQETFKRAFHKNAITQIEFSRNFKSQSTYCFLTLKGELDHRAVERAELLNPQGQKLIVYWVAKKCIEDRQTNPEQNAHTTKPANKMTRFG